MSERALRGTRLGATSYETDNGIDLAPRQDVEYACPNGHRFQMPFSVEADVPMVWECRVCGAQSLRVGGTVEEDKPGKPARTHWDMLLERRSIPELEEVLNERLTLLRDGGFGGISGGRRASTHAAAATAAAPATGAPAATQTDAVAASATSPNAAHETEAESASADTDSGTADPGSTKTAAKKTTKKTVGKKSPSTAPAKKAATSKPAPGAKAGERPAKKTVAKKP